MEGLVKMKFKKLCKKAAVLTLAIGVGQTALPTTFAGPQERIVAVAAENGFEQQIAGFPDSYKPYLRELHSKYPNWKFEPYNVGVNFETVVDNEMDPPRSGMGNKSLVAKSADSLLKRNTSADYNAATGEYIYKDSSSWVSAARTTVAWFLDPRNFLNEVNIFQFEKNSFDNSVHTLDGVKSILNTSFMRSGNGTIQYLDTKGKKVNTTTTYAEEFYKAGMQTGVSPFYLASKSVQEMGISGTSGSCSGSYTAKNGKVFKGYYNFYNIGANDGADPVFNGLTFASGSNTGATSFNRPWTSPMKAILGGAQFFYNNYISQKQNTGYFVRFNVASSTNKYSHQFMTNISGACQETATTYSAYSRIGNLADAKVFLIPVYENMPRLSNTISITSSAGKTATANLALNLRKGPGLGYEVVTTVKKGQQMSVLEGKRADDGYSYNNLKYPYWYRVKTEVDGKEVSGYISATSVDLAASTTIATDQTVKLPVKISQAGDAVYYHSDHPEIVSVDAQGNITGKKNGEATVYAFLANGKMDAIKIKVESVALNYSTKSLYVKNYAQLKASVPSDKQIVSWQSKDTKIVTVNDSGKVYGKGVGSTSVTVTTSDGAQKSCKVTVKPRKSTIRVSGCNYDRIRLNWTKSSYATGYTLYRREKGSSTYHKIATIKNRNTLSYTDKKAVNGKTYVYKVRAYKKVDGKNYYSGGTTAQATAKVGKSSVTSAKANRKKKSITIQWSKVSGASGYVLYRRYGTNGKWIKKKTLTGNGKISCTDGNKKKGTYYYRVRAYRKTGKKNIYGDYSTGKKVKM